MHRATLTVWCPTHSQARTNFLLPRPEPSMTARGVEYPVLFGHFGSARPAVSPPGFWWKLTLSWPNPGQWAAAQGLAGHWSVGSEQLLSYASLDFLGVDFSLCYFIYNFIIIIIITIIILLLIFILFQLLNCSYLNPRVLSLLPFQFSSPILLSGGSEQATLWCLVVGWG